MPTSLKTTVTKYLRTGKPSRATRNRLTGRLTQTAEEKAASTLSLFPLLYKHSRRSTSGRPTLTILSESAQLPGLRSPAQKFAFKLSRSLSNRPRLVNRPVRFGPRRRRPAIEFFLAHLVLGTQIVDNCLLLVIEPSGQKAQPSIATVEVYKFMIGPAVNCKCFTSLPMPTAVNH